MVFLAGIRAVRLTNLRDGQKFLASIINKRYRNEIESSVSRDLGYLLKVYLDYYENIEFDTRIGAIEQKLESLLKEK